MNIHDELTGHFRIDEAHKKALKKLDIGTIENLLYHFCNVGLIEPYDFYFSAIVPDITFCNRGFPSKCFSGRKRI